MSQEEREKLRLLMFSGGIKTERWEEMVNITRSEVWLNKKHRKIENLSMCPYRSSCPELFCQEVVLENFAKFTGKHLCQSVFFNKVAGLRSPILLKKRPWYRCFPKNFVKFFRTPSFIEDLWWLLLSLFVQTLYRPNLLSVLTFNVITKVRSCPV